MMTATRLVVHLHDDTEVTMPAGTRYALDRAGVRTVAPDGAERAFAAWDVLRVHAVLRAADRPAKADA
jgi:hypothetical protein